jgi:hypothetical protein
MQHAGMLQPMKHDALPGEKEILLFQVRDGDGLLTTHRLIIDTVKYSRFRGRMEQQHKLICDKRRAFNRLDSQPQPAQVNVAST